MTSLSTSTGAGTRASITLKLSQLQNLCKRDPAGYRSDYNAQILRLKSECDILALSPSSGICRPPPHLSELIQFAAAVSSSSYTDKCGEVSDLLVRLLLGQSTDSTDTVGTSDSTDDDLYHSFSLTLPTNALSLHKDIRKSCVSALILMRNKGQLPPLRLLQLFFRIMAIVPDKSLREQLYRHIVNDVRNINAKGKRDDVVNRRVQGFLHRIVSYTVPSDGTGGGQPTRPNETTDEATTLAARRAVMLTRELYRRKVWTDQRAVAILASGCQSSISAVASSSMRFFLGVEDRMATDKKQEEDETWEGVQQVDMHQHSKKTSKKKRVVGRKLKAREKEQKKRELEEEMDPEGASVSRCVDKGGIERSRKLYPAIQLLRDPQGLAESILRRLVRTTGYPSFEVKILAMNFVTRLVGNHELILLPLYPFLRKYMGGHQRDVTGVLAYVVQACHQTVPPEEVHGLLKTIVHEFVTERCSGEQIAVGINACRAICARVPCALVPDDNEGSMEEDGSGGAAVSMDVEAFVRDLAGYVKHRDRSVAIAGKGWLNMVRESFPSLLAGKDRGKAGSALHKAGERPMKYGETHVTIGLEGAELLAEYESKKVVYLRRKERMKAMGQEEDDSSDEDDDGERWEKMNDAGDDAENDEEEVNQDADGAETDTTAYTTSDKSDETAPKLIPIKVVDGKIVPANKDEKRDTVESDTPQRPPTTDGNETDEDDNYDENDDNNELESEEEPIDLSTMTAEQRLKLRQDISSNRIFTSADLKKISRLVERQERARRDPRVAARTKRRLAQGKIDFQELSDDDEDDDMDGWNSDDEDDQPHVKGAVRAYDIMANARKKRASKMERLEKILAGREKFEFKDRMGGSTNAEKKRKKSFVMTKFSFANRSKQGSKETARRGTLKKNKKSRMKNDGNNEKRRRKF